MGFDEEWGRLRSDAAESRSTGMRLNSADAGGAASGDGDVASTPAQKKAAANDIETDLEPSTRKAGNWADDASGDAVKGFDGWDTAKGLKTVQETWESQVKTLMGRLSAEKGALRGAGGLFARNDLDTHGTFLQSRSKLNGL
ncbi:hypothetical protein ACIQ7D_25585 [Streptomyces sp. NPDC096310]|uniref:hypothetical protein n=1 Tax=Streptomyces sp. NPDC096310 TaxID=3366082 RepID=UPI00380441C4